MSMSKDEITHVIAQVKAIQTRLGQLEQKVAAITPPQQYGDWTEADIQKFEGMRK